MDRVSGVTRSVGEAFALAAAARPATAAVRAGDRSLCYEDLSARARNFAGGLAQRGVGVGGMVALALPRGVDLIVAMVGCALRGAAYIPVDPSWPRARVDRLLAIARPRLVVGGADAGDGSVAFAEVAAGGDSGGASADAGEVSRDDPLYVMFTSGSTGEPKGVVVPQRGVLRLVIDPDFMEVGPKSVWLHASATSFDASTLEVWAPLLNGGTVVVVEERLPSLAVLAGTIRRDGVTDAWLTASVFNAFVDHDPRTLGALSRLFTGGERLSPAHVSRCLEMNPGLALINGYGPTENTTFTCCHRVRAADTDDPWGVPIGRPIRGTGVVVVDDALREVDAGAPGELLACGDGVALGYLGDAALTRERFVGLPGREGVWYRTGDLVRRRADGALAFLGRRDRQEKIRGHRVELAEVEQALRRCAGVLDAVAVAVGDRADERSLAAACVVSGTGIDAGAIRAALAASEPGHLVPDRIVCVKALPLGSSGKADRGAVEAMFRPDDGPEGAAGDDPGEDGAWAVVREELRRLLPGSDPQPADRFVAVGGHSLTALRLAAALEERTGVAVGVAEILGSGRLGEIALAIDRRPGVGRTLAGGESAVEGPIEATTSQRQMYFESAVDPSGLAYVEHIAFGVEGELEAAALAEAWRAIVRRHEVLRTRLEFVGDRLHQVIEPADAVEAPFEERPFAPESGQSLEACVAESVDRPLRPSEAPACRATLLTMGGKPGVVVLSFHHGLVDEWSLELLAGELSVLLGSGSGDDGGLAVPSPYRVFGAWEREAIDRGAVGAAASRLVRLPRAEPVGVAPGPVVALDFAFDASEHRAINAAAHARGVTAFAFLLTLWGETLCDALGRETVAVLTPLSLRVVPGLQRVVGCCTAVHAIVVEREGSGSDGVEATRAQIHSVYSGGIAPLTEVLSEARRLAPGRVASLTEFGFALQQSHGFAPVVPGIATRALRLPSPVARFPLSLVLWVRDGRLEGRVEAVAGGNAQSVQQGVLTAFTLRVRGAVARGASRARRSDYARPVAGATPARTSSVGSGGDARSDAAVRRAWEETLGVSGATPRSDFFASGGHSLLALRLAARLRLDPGFEVALGPFLQHPTLGWLIDRARDAEQGNHAAPGIGVDLGAGPLTVLCFPGGYGNPLVFARLADALRRRGTSGIRLRCYDLAGALSGGDPGAGLRRLLDEAANDWATLEGVVGLLGYSIGGLLALMADRPSGASVADQRLWLVDAFPPTHFLTLSQRLRRSAVNALRDPVHAPAAFINGVRMQRSRLHTPEMTDGPGLSRGAIEALKSALGPARYEPWAGPATVIKSGRRPLWQLNLRADPANGLGDTLRGPTRTVTMPSFHYDLMSRGADRVADEVLRDIARVAGARA